MALWLRWVNEKKFIRGLPLRLDEAERKWNQATPIKKAEPELIEHEPDGSEAQSLLGGTLQARHKFISKDE